MSIVHVGTGPAFWVGNNGSGDIASFNDIDQGIEVLHIGGTNGDFPNVGVKTSAPNKDFTVNGEISASNTIWDANGNSNNWNSVYSTVQSNSASNWDYQGTDLKDLSANWQNTYTDYSTNSASYATINFVDSNFLPLSGGAIQGNVSTTGGVTVGDGLGTANLYVSGSKVGINTETPNEALTVVGNISATGIYYGDGSGLTNIGNAGVDSWVIANSANATFDSVSAVSLSGTFYGDGSNLIGASLPGQSDINTLVQTSSASWDYQGTDLKDLSANWQNTFTEFSNASASYSTSNFVQSNFLPLSGGIVSGPLSVNGDLSSSNIVYSGNGNSDQWNGSFTIVQTNSAAWIASSAYIRRFDYVPDGIDYSYSGVAPEETLESDPSWKITRLAFGDEGALFSTGVAQNVTWNERLTATYI